MEGILFAMDEHAVEYFCEALTSMQKELGRLRDYAHPEESRVLHTFSTLVRARFPELYEKYSHVLG